MFELEAWNRAKKVVESSWSNLKRLCSEKIEAEGRNRTQCVRVRVRLPCRNLCSKEVVRDYSFQAPTVQLIYEHMGKNIIANFRLTCLLSRFNRFL